MEQKDYLTIVTQFIKTAQLTDQVEIHKKKMDRTLFERMQHQLSEKKIVSSITTLTNEISEALPIETGEHDMTLQTIAFIMVISADTTSLTDRLFTLYPMIEGMTRLLNHQRWGLTYAYPPTEINAMDLYGLSYDKDKLVASEGWDPSIQAYAKALYQATQDDPYPKNLTLWTISWQQKFRFSTFFSEPSAYDKEEKIIKAQPTVCINLVP